MTTRRDFMLGMAAAGAMPKPKNPYTPKPLTSEPELLGQKPAVDGKIDPFVGEHVYFLFPGDSYSIDTEATDQWERSKKVTVIIEEIQPGDVSKDVQRKLRDQGQIILRKPKHGG